MPDLHPEARALLESDALAHMVTVNPDGSPQVTCVWVGVEGDEIVSAHLPRNQKVRNVPGRSSASRSNARPGRSPRAVLPRAPAT